MIVRSLLLLSYVSAAHSGEEREVPVSDVAAD